MTVGRILRKNIYIFISFILGFFSKTGKLWTYTRCEAVHKTTRMWKMIQMTIDLVTQWPSSMSGHGSDKQTHRPRTLVTIGRILCFAQGCGPIITRSPFCTTSIQWIILTYGWRCCDIFGLLWCAKFLLCFFVLFRFFVRRFVTLGTYDTAISSLKIA